MDEAGTGPSIVFLPALSSISTRTEMCPLFDRLAPEFRVSTVDWPGFGDLPRGRLEGTTEVLLVFRADSENEIDERLKADPWTRSGILSTSRIARWNLRLGEVG